MKKILFVFLLMVPAILGAQNKHSFELGGGVSFPGEMTRDVSNESLIGLHAMHLYGEYRYQIWRGLSVGAQYQLMPRWGRYHEGYPDKTEVAKFRDLSHSLNALVEYRFFSTKTVSPFIGVGAGPQIQHKWPGDEGSWKKQGVDLHARAGVELFHHLRLTVGHLHYQSKVFRAAQPSYYFSAGWVF